MVGVLYPAAAVWISRIGARRSMTATPSGASVPPLPKRIQTDTAYGYGYGRPVYGSAGREPPERRQASIGRSTA